MKRPYDDIIGTHRDRIDALDREIVALLAKRAGIIHEVALLKAEHGIPSILPARVEEVRELAASHAAACGIDPDMVRRLYTILIDYSCALEDKVKDKVKAEKKAGK